MKTLLEKICELPPRETSGALAQDRLSFQTCWGLQLALKLHQSGADYAIGFEIHDDIVQLDSSAAPTKISFFQVKTKAKGKFSLAELIAPVPSTAGKLYHNYLMFPDSTELLGFVSNVSFAPISAGGAMVSFSTLDANDAKTFCDALIKEHTGFTNANLKLFHYVPSGIPLQAYETHLTGLIIEFIESALGSLNYNPKSFATVLMGECHRKSKRVPDKTSAKEIFGRKFLTKQDLTNHLGSLLSASDGRSKWSDAAADLGNITFSEKMRIRDGWRTYEAELLQVANVPINTFRDRVRTLIDQNGIADHVGAHDYINSIRYKLSASEIPLGKDEAYVKGAILYQVYGYGRQR